MSPPWAEAWGRGSSRSSSQLGAVPTGPLRTANGPPPTSCALIRTPANSTDQTWYSPLNSACHMPAHTALSSAKPWVCTGR